MSLFDTDNDETIQSIRIFNNLSDEEKALVVSALDPKEFKLKQYFEQLAPLLSKIFQDLSKHDEIQIGNRLVDLGLEETYARIFPANMKKQFPPFGYYVREVNRLSDEQFTKDCEKIVNELWIDHTKPVEIIEKYDITEEQLLSVIKIITILITRLLRGDTSEKQIINELTDNNISSNKADVFRNIVRTHSVRTKDTMLFSAVQDIRDNLDIISDIEHIKKQNQTIMNYMYDLTKMIKKISPDYN